MFGYVCYTSVLRDELVCVVLNQNGHFVEEHLLTTENDFYSERLEKDTQFYFVETQVLLGEILIRDIAAFDVDFDPYENIMQIKDDQLAQTKFFLSCTASLAH